MGWKQVNSHLQQIEVNFLSACPYIKYGAIKKKTQFVLQLQKEGGLSFRFKGKH